MKTKNPYKVPKAMQEHYDVISGLTVDARHIPRHLQEIAYEKGLIPYIPGDE